MDLVILEKIEPSILNGLGYIVRLEKKNGNSSKKTKEPCEFNGYRRSKTVAVIKMGTFVKKNKLNNSSKCLHLDKKLDRSFRLRSFCVYIFILKILVLYYFIDYSKLGYFSCLIFSLHLFLFKRI